MENELGKNTYKKIGVIATTLFTLMLVLFFVFVYFDSIPPKKHTIANEPTEHEQVENHSASKDHAVTNEPAEHAQTEDHGADHSSEKE